MVLLIGGMFEIYCITWCSSAAPPKGKTTATRPTASPPDLLRHRRREFQVEFSPPKSGVRTWPVAITAFNPAITRVAAAASPTCSNIIAEAQMAAMGLA